MIDGKPYSNYSSLTNESRSAGVDLFVSRPEGNCFEVSFPSGAGVRFCEDKGMLSIVVTTIQRFTNNTRGLLGTFNSNMGDDFMLPDGTVIYPSNDTDIHFNFGLKCKYE